MENAFLFILGSSLTILKSPPLDSLAYIDPSSGGLLFQLLALLFAIFSGGILFFSRQIKSTIARLRRFLKERSSRG